MRNPARSPAAAAPSSSAVPPAAGGEGRGVELLLASVEGALVRSRAFRARGLVHLAALEAREAATAAQQLFLQLDNALRRACA